ncbi:MAG: hypothetical protein U0175_13505 [Caldilineaceae bacterium]
MALGRGIRLPVPWGDRKGPPLPVGHFYLRCLLEPSAFQFCP